MLWLYRSYINRRNIVKYYVIFDEDSSIRTSETKDFNDNEYDFIKTRESDVGSLDYYSHKSRTEFYKTTFKTENTSPYEDNRIWEYDGLGNKVYRGSMKAYAE